MLGLEVDLSGLDKSIEEAKEIEKALSGIELEEVLEWRPERGRGPEYIF